MVHTVHTNRDKRGRRGREGRVVRDREGREEGQDAMGCALLGQNEEKQLSHTPPSHFKNKKRTSKIIETPPYPHILKNNNTVAVGNGREGKMDAVRTTGR